MVIRAAISSLRAARCLGAAAVIGGLALAAPASAENPAAVPDPVAQALFQDGRDLVDKGEWEAGCTKFEASMLLYPAASTLLNIARCYEHNQKLASAWSAYKRVQVLNRETVGDERKRAIDELVVSEIARITPLVPKIKLVMKKPVPGLVLRKDGEQLPAAIVGTELPLDGGEHEITAEAPGYRPIRTRFEVKNSTLREIAVDLVPESQIDPLGAVVRVPSWAWASGGAGLVFLGVAAGFRIDQGYVEGYQSGRCEGNVLGGCPPKSQYDPGPDNNRKNIDFALFLGFGVAGVAALSAAVIGIVRGTSPPPPPPVTASVFFTREGGLATAAFQF